MARPAGGPAEIEAPQPPPQAAPLPPPGPLPVAGPLAPAPPFSPAPAAPLPPVAPAAVASVPAAAAPAPAPTPPPAPGLRTLGVALTVAGVVALVGAALWPLVSAARGARGSAPGDLPAVGLVLLLLGFAACFPSLLTDGTGEAGYSTMRVAVLAIVCVFCLVIVKAGWGGDLTVSDSWWHVLTVALGGKVAQAFAEAWKAGGASMPGGGGGGRA